MKLKWTPKLNQPGKATRHCVEVSEKKIAVALHRLFVCNIFTNSIIKFHFLFFANFLKPQRFLPLIAVSRCPL